MQKKQWEWLVEREGKILKFACARVERPPLLAFASSVLLSRWLPRLQRARRRARRQVPSLTSHMNGGKLAQNVE